MFTEMSSSLIISQLTSELYFSIVSALNRPFKMLFEIALFLYGGETRPWSIRLVASNEFRVSNCFDSSSNLPESTSIIGLYECLMAPSGDYFFVEAVVRLVRGVGTLSWKIIFVLNMTKNEFLSKF